MNEGEERAVLVHPYLQAGVVVDRPGDVVRRWGKRLVEVEVRGHWVTHRGFAGVRGWVTACAVLVILMKEKRGEQMVSPQPNQRRPCQQ